MERLSKGFDDPAAGNSGPGGSLPGRGTAPPLIVNLSDVTVRAVILRFKTGMERRVEIVSRRTGEPLVSLLSDEARALGYMLRARSARD